MARPFTVLVIDEHPGYLDSQARRLDEPGLVLLIIHSISKACDLYNENLSLNLIIVDVLAPGDVAAFVHEVRLCGYNGEIMAIGGTDANRAALVAAGCSGDITYKDYVVDWILMRFLTRG